MQGTPCATAGDFDLRRLDALRETGICYMHSSSLENCQFGSCLSAIPHMAQGVRDFGTGVGYHPSICLSTLVYWYRVVFASETVCLVNYLATVIW